MGEVYRARDTKLGRDVALKILPAVFATDPDRLARFQREAKTLASLNHPNIGGIYGLEEAGEVTALVLELVEGPTLADRIAQGPIPVDEALPIAQQIAGALEAAHEQGIIHRDLKPANIKLRPDGAVKVLDFGLAKATQGPDSGTLAPGHLSDSPTITTPAVTRIGVIMGTAAYMSPEQARGKPLDKRTDIWAFGCVLAEMLTGRRAFSGDDVSDVLASILAREPDLAAVPATTPPPIRRLLRRCLAKDRNERLRDIGDARIEIREVLGGADAQVAAPGADRRRHLRGAAIAALAAIALAAVAAAVWSFRAPPATPELRVDIGTPPTAVPESLAISPDGRSIAFVANTPERQSRLWVRALETGSVQPLPGTDGARHPFWSPNSRSIAFFADNRLKRIDLDGAAVRILANVYRGTGGTWSRTGVILVSSLGDPITRISEDGGEPVELSKLAQEGSNFAPNFLPDGRHFLYYLRGSADARGIYVAQLDGAAPARRLIDSDSSAGAVYASSGHLLFVRRGTLLAQPFDPSSLALTGEPFPVTDGTSACACLGLSVSHTGSIAYRMTTQGSRRQFVWFDRFGKPLGDVGSGAMSTPSLSRDGRVVGYRGNTVDGNVDVWMLDARRGVYSRLTSHAADDVSPVWSPDGERVAFSSNRKGTHDIYVKPAHPGGTEQLVFESAQEKMVDDWSPDGRFVVFDSRDMKSRGDVWAIPLDGSGKPLAVAQTAFEELKGQFSPDGKWIAYQSDESGRYEIYVQSFPEGRGKWPISTNGGAQARWRRDGKELFYVGLDGRLMAVPIDLKADGKAPEVGTPKALFAPPLGGMVQQADFRHQYVVSDDGQRFLIGTVTEATASPITVILNWKPKS